MRESRIRQRILGDHDLLRGLLEEVERQASRVYEEAGAGVAVLRALGLQLLTQFSDHLALEDRVLAPALRGAGPIGRERVEQLAADHREQRVLIEYILGGLRDQSRPAAVLSDELHGLVELLLEDMAQEELTILERRLLEDPGPLKAPSPHSLRARGVGR